MNVEEIKNKLTELAFERTTPFCYMCYQLCPNGRCEDCGSDDLMRHLDGVGVEYGTEWIVESILEEELEAIDLDDSFEQMIEDCYGTEVQIGVIKSDVSTAIKNLDPIAWDVAKGEYLDSLIEDVSIVEAGNGYYWKHELEAFLS